jgi:hypothetical protein
MKITLRCHDIIAHCLWHTLMNIFITQTAYTILLGCLHVRLQNLHVGHITSSHMPRGSKQTLPSMAPHIVASVPIVQASNKTCFCYHLLSLIFIYTLFNVTVSNSDYVASNNKINE